MENCKVVAARWLLDPGFDARSIPDLACQLLVDGYDTTSLRILAGESPNSSIHDLNPAFEYVLNELDLLPASRIAAGLILAQEVARRISSGEMSEVEGIATIWRIKDAVPEIVEDSGFKDIASVENDIRPVLMTFLTADDLDDLLRARHKLLPLTADDLRTIRSIVHNWDPPQAVANLLFHLELLPEDLRFATYLRGMGEPWGSYLKFATFEGGPGIPKERMSAEQLDTVRQHFFEILERDTGVLAQRASLYLSYFYQASDAQNVLRFLAHPNDTVVHNVLAWLLTEVIHRDLEALNALLGASVLPDALCENVTTKVREHLAAKERGEVSMVDRTLYAYMPNLNEWHPPMP